MIHDFREQLRWSEQGSDAPFWAAVYRQAFPDLVNFMSAYGDNAAQRRGIDRVIVLESGKILTIDEKKRARSYPDILLEYVSNDLTGAPGWMEKDLQIDYLAYAFMATQKVYLFPWRRLQRAWRANRDQWFRLAERRERGFGLWGAQNQEYNTWSLAVPIPILVRAIEEAALSLWPIIQVQLPGEENGSA